MARGPSVPAPPPPPPLTIRTAPRNQLICLVALMKRNRQWWRADRPARRSRRCLSLMYLSRDVRQTWRTKRQTGTIPARRSADGGGPGARFGRRRQFLRRTLQMLAQGLVASARQTGTFRLRGAVVRPLLSQGSGWRSRLSKGI